MVYFPRGLKRTEPELLVSSRLQAIRSGDNRKEWCTAQWGFSPKQHLSATTCISHMKNLSAKPHSSKK